MGAIVDGGAFYRTKCIPYFDLISSQKVYITAVILVGDQINDDPKHF